MRPRALAPLFALAAAAVLVASCSRSGDSNPAPTPPADAPAPVAVDFSRPLNAVGNEPFWALKIRPEGLSFSAPGSKDIAAPNGGPKVETDQATWSANGSDGMPVSAVVRAAVCQDSASGLSYPFTATIKAGGRALTGCAAYADAMPKEG